MRVEKECTRKEKQYLLYMKSLKCTKVQKSIKLNDSVYVWELKYSWRDFIFFILYSLHFISLIVKIYSEESNIWDKKVYLSLKVQDIVHHRGGSQDRTAKTVLCL